MSDLSSNTRVHICGIRTDGKRQYLVKPEVNRNAKGEYQLWPLWSDFPKDSQSMSLEYALIFRDRMRREHGAVIHFTLKAGDESFIEFREPEETTDHTKRVPMAYKGLIATPGFDTRSQTPCWYVRFPGTAIESLPRQHVEEVGYKALERQDLLPYAERAPEAPKQQTVVHDEAPAGPRMRPGDLDYRAPIRRGQ